MIEFLIDMIATVFTKHGDRKDVPYQSTQYAKSHAEAKQKARYAAQATGVNVARIKSSTNIRTGDKE